MTIEGTPEFEMGQESEALFASLMAERGFIVVPAYSIGERTAGGAPCLMTGGGRFAAPDVLMLSGKSHRWVDVKAKSVPTWRRCHPGPRWEHGIDKSIADEYRMVQERSGITMSLIVHERASPLDPDSHSPIAGRALWLAIRLDDAFVIGDHRPDWPGGSSAERRRGRRGAGGLLWARNMMADVTDYIL